MSDFARQPAIPAEKPVVRPAVRPTLTTNGPLIASNDVAAYIVAAIMNLGPLAAAALFSR
jgi:hypothetical protein